MKQGLLKSLLSSTFSIQIVITSITVDELVVSEQASFYLFRTRKVEVKGYRKRHILSLSLYCPLPLSVPSLKKRPISHTLTAN